jgi:DNA repair photolyase
VARLNDAGVPCGVLVAPVLPGISDTPEQLDAVVKACVESGAVSVSPVVLHLRPRVKDLYLRWLGDARPDLMERYAQLYPRSYAPRAVQERVAGIVRDAVCHYGGVARDVESALEPVRRPTAPATIPPPTEEQLSLTLS